MEQIDLNYRPRDYLPLPQETDRIKELRSRFFDDLFLILPPEFCFPQMVHNFSFHTEKNPDLYFLTIRQNDFNINMQENPHFTGLWIWFQIRC